MLAASLGLPAWGRRFGAPMLLAATAILIHLLPTAGSLLEYSRTGIAAGEAWRLLTGHWTHGSLDHLSWDAVVFAVLGCILAKRSLTTFWWTVTGSAVAISLALFAIEPRWETYRGLSGIDAALFAALAVTLWRETERRPERALAAGALLLLGAKILFELATGSALFTAAVPGHQVVPLAHLVGLATGLMVALISRGGFFATRAAPALIRVTKESSR